MTKLNRTATNNKGHQLNKTKGEKLFFDTTLFNVLNENDNNTGEYVIGQKVVRVNDSILHIQTKVNNSNEEVNQAVIVTNVNGKDVVKVNTWDKTIDGLSNRNYKGKTKNELVIFDATLFYQLNENDEEKGEYVFDQKVTKVSDNKTVHIQTKVNNSNEEVNQAVEVEIINGMTKVTVNDWDKTIDGLANIHFKDAKKDIVVFDPTLFYELNSNDDETGETVLDQEIKVVDNKDIHIQTKLINNEEIKQSVVVETLACGRELIRVNTWDKTIDGRVNKQFKA